MRCAAGYGSKGLPRFRGIETALKTLIASSGPLARRAFPASGGLRLRAGVGVERARDAARRAFPASGGLRLPPMNTSPCTIPWLEGPSPLQGD